MPPRTKAGVSHRGRVPASPKAVAKKASTKGKQKKVVPEGESDNQDDSAEGEESEEIGPVTTQTKKVPTQTKKGAAAGSKKGTGGAKKGAGKRK